MNETGHRLPQDGLDERFRRALDSILDLVVVERAIRDDDGRIVDFVIEWMNNAPVDVARRPREELIGRRISELYPALAGGELIASYARVVETGEPLVVPVMPYEDVIDGQTVSGYYTVQATRFEDSVLVASRDITTLETSRRELEIALRELEAAQRLSRLGTWRIDLTAKPSASATVSTELQRICGLPPGPSRELDVDGIDRFVHPDDLDLVTRAHQRAMSARHPIVIEHRVVRDDGTVRHVRTYSEPLVDDDAVLGLWGTTQDISDTIANRDALDAEHGRRVTAEMLADVASALNAARAPQEIADGVARAMRGFNDEVMAIALAVVEPDQPVLQSYFGGASVSGELAARYMRAPLSVDTPASRVVNTGRPLLVGDRVTQRDEFPAIRADIDSAGYEAVAGLPLRRASGEVFGALVLAWRQPREFDRALVALLHDIVVVVSRAAERLELLELERSVARSLQLGLLALDVRSTGAIVRARYRAADEAMEIGGDWYDAVDLADGRLAVAVGDVVGRGLPAATVMGQLRAALGITALTASDAADAIRMLDRYALHVPGAHCATVAFAIVDPDAQTVSYATAGHPPPLVVSPRGDVEFLHGGRSWPLGIESKRVRAPADVHRLEPGSLLLLYTDGLVERRGEPMQVGFDRLESVVRRNWNLPLRRLKQAIFGALADVGGESGPPRKGLTRDDIALVAVRTAGADDLLFADAFRAARSEQAPARRRLRAWLERVGVDGETRDALLLAVGEAIANAIDHGSRGDETQVVKVEVARRDRDILVSVSDTGQWQPGVEGYFTGRGRGHLLMQALVDDVHIDTDHQGTIVTLRLDRQRELV
jgi:PAS domain S-box-containing protein